MRGHPAAPKGDGHQVKVLSISEARDGKFAEDLDFARAKLAGRLKDRGPHDPDFRDVIAQVAANAYNLGVAEGARDALRDAATAVRSLHGHPVARLVADEIESLAEGQS